MTGQSRRCSRNTFLFALGILLQLCQAAGQELITDRPDQTESAFIVPKGSFQIEAGWTHSRDSGSNLTRTIDSFPETLLRIALLKRLEVRLGFGGLVFAEHEATGTRAVQNDGVSDTSIGGKLELVSGSGLRPQVAVIGALTLPTGETGYSSGGADPSFRLAFSHGLGERLALGYNAGASWTSDAGELSGERSGFFDWTLTLGAGATARLGVFAELFGSHGEGLRQTSFDTGLTYLLGDRLQLDTSVALGISAAAPDWSVGAGISYRFLK